MPSTVPETLGLVMSQPTPWPTERWPSAPLNTGFTPAVHIGGVEVPHGLRPSFRDWATHTPRAARQVCELALAHVNRDRVEAACMRSDLFERRRVLMQQWADFVAASS